MRFEIDSAEVKRAKHPHEIFLLNLITNHILLFIGVLMLSNTYPLLMLLVPAISFFVIGYLMNRARQSGQRDSWFVHLNWILCLRRCKLFLVMLAVMSIVLFLGWLAIDVFEAQPVFVYALSGAGILPVMVGVLVMILMESDALHQASQGRLPTNLVEQHPPPAEIKVIEEDRAP